MANSVKTAIRVLKKIQAIQSKRQTQGKEFADGYAFNGAAKCAWFAMSTNGLCEWYTVSESFLGFIERIEERRSALGVDYGISDARKNWGWDLVSYCIGALFGAHGGCSPYTSTHDLDDLSLRGDDLDLICDRFLNEIKEDYSKFREWHGWGKYIKEMGESV